VEVDFLVFDRTPEPLDEDVVPPRTLAIHRDGDFRLLQHRREVHRGELRTLDALLFVKRRSWFD
jgi:hypothetical protein